MITRAKLSTVKQGMPSYRSMLAGNSTYWAFESIATATGTGSSTTITFSSIPSTYQYLQIRVLSRSIGTGSGNDPLGIRFNGDATSTAYAYHFLYGDGVNAPAAGGQSSYNRIDVNALCVGGGAATGILAAGIIDIHDYASTTKNKTVRILSGLETNVGGGVGQIFLTSGLWMNTSAINSISLINFNSSNSFSTNTVVALYGIKGA